jgi:hypothetical protein
MEFVAACTVLQLRLRTNHLMRWQLTHGQPLLAAKGRADWVLAEWVFCSSDDHLMTEDGKD